MPLSGWTSKKHSDESVTEAQAWLLGRQTPSKQESGSVQAVSEPSPQAPPTTTLLMAHAPLPSHRSGSPAAVDVEVVEGTREDEE